MNYRYVNFMMCYDIHKKYNLVFCYRNRKKREHKVVQNISILMKKSVL